MENRMLQPCVPAPAHCRHRLPACASTGCVEMSAYFAVMPARAALPSASRTWQCDGRRQIIVERSKPPDQRRRPDRCTLRLGDALRAGRAPDRDRPPGRSTSKASCLVIAVAVWLGRVLLLPRAPNGFYSRRVPVRTPTGRWNHIAKARGARAAGGSALRDGGRIGAMPSFSILRAASNALQSEPHRPRRADRPRHHSSRGARSRMWSRTVPRSSRRFPPGYAS